mmetsp:Transcript_23230/g.33289  ORF Transcript_23230/g.33289 Transcript_23230/m.33289 type:complete len:149 (-) Transcript_23230:41-487(-)
MRNSPRKMDLRITRAGLVGKWTIYHVLSSDVNDTQQQQQHPLDDVTKIIYIESYISQVYRLLYHANLSSSTTCDFFYISASESSLEWGCEKSAKFLSVLGRNQIIYKGFFILKIYCRLYSLVISESRRFMHLSKYEAPSLEYDIARKC